MYVVVLPELAGVGMFAAGEEGLDGADGLAAGEGAGR
jgi:hypothetical protein